MKSTFSRNFSSIAIILLLALTVLGTSFQIMVRSFLTESTLTGLRTDAGAIADLAAAYSLEGSLTNWQFLLNLDVASKVTDADVVICNAQGKVVLCPSPICWLNLPCPNPEEAP